MKFETLILAAASVFMAACGHKTNDDGNVASGKGCLSDTIMSMIRIDTVKVTPIEDALRLTGIVGCDENHMAKIFPANSGQVVCVKVALGDKVSKGQILAEIKSADIAGGYDDLNAAKADYATAKRNFENIEGMYGSGLSSDKELQEAKNGMLKAKALMSKIESQLAINGGGGAKEGGTYMVKSPTSGYIVERNVSEGSFIRSDNSANLFTVASLSDVWIWANVFERDIANVGIGFSAKVRTLSYPDRIFNGKVDQATSVLDPVSKVMKIRVILKNQDMLLKPGMYADVFVSKKESKEGIAVSSSAILSENGQSYVVVFKDKCHVSIRKVDILKTTGEVSYVSKGLEPGEMVITQNQLLVYNQLKEKAE